MQGLASGRQILMAGFGQDREGDGEEYQVIIRDLEWASSDGI